MPPLAFIDDIDAAGHPQDQRQHQQHDDAAAKLAHVERAPCIATAIANTALLANSDEMRRLTSRQSLRDREALVTTGVGDVCPSRGHSSHKYGGDHINTCCQESVGLKKAEKNARFAQVPASSGGSCAS